MAECNDMVVLKYGKSVEIEDYSKYIHIENVRELSCVEGKRLSASAQRGDSFIRKLCLYINYTFGNNIIFLPKFWIKGIKKYWDIKKILDDLYINGEKFDVVISTYGDVENVFAGRYAANLWHCKYIQDYRDPFPTGQRYSFITKCIFNYAQRWSMRRADAVTAVSQGLLKRLNVPSGKMSKVIYNGYIHTRGKELKVKLINKLVFCYTGTIYTAVDDISPLFEVIGELIAANEIEKEKVVVRYAGNQGEYLLQQAKLYNLDDIVEDNGYVTATRAEEIQSSSDVFVVASWNNNGEEGIITGKFFEGIRAGIPILALVAGNKPNSELYSLNERYHYGFCYENVQREKLYPSLKEYILTQYQQKKIGKPLIYNPKPTLFTDFTYRNLSAQMEMLCRNLIGK